TDPRSDLALIKIDANDLPTLKIGTDENTFVGEDVIAIGYALDLGNGAGAPTVSRGIVSAKNRAIDEGTGQNSVLGSIQTDASINHGNSGGPLLNYKAEVVGVNTAIAPDSETGGIAPGIGFAVGADTIQAVYDQLKATGKVDRGFLGIQCFQPVLSWQAKQLGIPTDVGGVYLPPDTQFNCQVPFGVQGTSVPSGPAQTGGIKPGDVLTSIGGTAVADESQLAVALIKHHSGEKVDVIIYRDGKKITVSVTLGTSPS
ncbi:MAG: S1C family serine protease, partial [Tepidiformaceae bacterium]